MRRHKLTLLVALFASAAAQQSIAATSTVTTHLVTTVNRDATQAQPTKPVGEITAVPLTDDMTDALDEPNATIPLAVAQSATQLSVVTEPLPVTAAAPIVEIDSNSPFAESDSDSSFEVLPHSGSPEIALLLNDNVNPLLWQGINNRLRNLADVRHLYAQMNYRPLWTDDGHITPLAAQVIEATKQAWQHALRPSVYHSEATSALYAGQAVAEPEKFDIVLTDAFITFKKHLANGIVDPKQQFDTWNVSPEALDFLALYRQAFQHGHLGQILSVTDPDYHQLQQAYIDSVQQPADAEPEMVKVPLQKMGIGSRGAAVTALRQRLGLPVDSDLYDKTVRQAVRDYQRDNGLSADGIAGRHTIHHLNGIPIGNRTELLAINMERLRWSKTPAADSYVWVNIPAYRMAIRNDKQVLFESDVIVGRPERPTPVFHDTLEHVVLAPYWNVPRTIFKEDKLPLLQKNPNALGKSMQVLNTSTGKVVRASSVNWKKGGTGYRLRQLPGPRNSLGRMKFLFPNRHAIYLHDTPNRKLFKRSRRAFSSGCIRVAKAEDLAVFLLNDKGYDRKRIKDVSRKTKEKWVNLTNSKRYPVQLNYYTAWVDNTGNVQYSTDIYGHDKPLTALYQAALNEL